MRVEMRFSMPGSDEEEVRVYEGISCKEAVEKFNEEFQD